MGVVGPHIPANFLLEVAKGNVPGHSVVHKFGHSNAVSTTIVPIAEGNIYQTPTSLTTLEIVSDDANDTAAGTGAQEVTIIGIGAGWVETSTTVEMNGVTAATIDTDFYRVYRAYVSRSGTYADATAGSHAGNITIRVESAGATWATISSNGFPLGQTEIGAYTIPAGKIGYLYHADGHIETAKTVNVYGFIRTNADDTTTPYTGIMRIFYQEHGLTDEWKYGESNIPNKFIGPCDIGFMAVKNSAGTAGVSAHFEILLVDGTE